VSIEVSRGLFRLKLLSWSPEERGTRYYGMVWWAGREGGRGEAEASGRAGEQGGGAAQFSFNHAGLSPVLYRSAVRGVYTR
jgi:hypothetical protein